MLFAVAMAVGLVGWSFVANLGIGDTLYTARNLVLTGALLLVARRVGLDWPTLGFGSDTVGAGLRWGRLAVFVVIVVVAAGAALGEVVRPVGLLLMDQRADLATSELVSQVLVRLPLGTAVFEEVAFRGVLLAALLQVASTGWAVAWSSLAFGLWHIAPTIEALRINEVAPASGAGLWSIVGAVAVTTVGGVVFALLRVVSGSLVAPVLAHWAVSSVALLAAAMTQRTGG